MVGRATSRVHDQAGVMSLENSLLSSFDFWYSNRTVSNTTRCVHLHFRPSMPCTRYYAVPTSTSAIRVLCHQCQKVSYFTVILNWAVKPVDLHNPSTVAHNRTWQALALPFTYASPSACCRNSAYWTLAADRGSGPFPARVSRVGSHCKQLASPCHKLGGAEGRKRRWINGILVAVLSSLYSSCTYLNACFLSWHCCA